MSEPEKFSVMITSPVSREEMKYLWKEECESAGGKFPEDVELTFDPVLDADGYTLGYRVSGTAIRVKVGP